MIFSPEGIEHICEYGRFEVEYMFDPCRADGMGEITALMYRNGYFGVMKPHGAG